MIIQIDTALGVPAYQQIVDQVVASVRDGRLVGGAKLPTVRRLADDLDLAPNTVAKAYRTLEAEGHVETRGRLGTFVAPGRPEASGDDVHVAASRLVAAACRAGLDVDTTIGVVRRLW